LTAELHVLLVGDADYEEFRAPAAALARSARVHSAADMATAVELLASGLRPDVVVIAQRRSGEIAAEAVEPLRRLAPLAPVIALQSSWCEGEGRSGRPLPGVLRVSWRQFESQIVPGLAPLREGRLPDWAGPATLTPEERLLRRSANETTGGRGTVGIVSHSAESRRLLEDICRAGGWSIVHLPGTALRPMRQADSGTAASTSNRPPGQDGRPAASALDVVIWDASELPEDAASVVRRLSKGEGQAGTIILLGFPRTADLQRAAAAGAVAVVAKPFSPHELLAEIDRAASRRGASGGE
jgi:CheY-like chemotaxis protein